MADDLDKFVLQYQVDLKDSIARLEKLHEKMDGVKARGGKAKEQLKEFASGAAGELNKLVPGVDAVSNAVKLMGAEFAAAAAGVAVLAVGVKAVLDLRTQYNNQRQQGMEFGMSGVRLEDYQRKLQRTGGGYVSRDSAAEGIKQFVGMATTAYQDPSRLGREARIMRMLGVNVGERGFGSTGTVQELQQLAAGLQGKSEADVQGIARATGIDPNWLLSVKRQGANGMGHITDMTSQEIDNRNQAQDSLDRFNAELQRFKENINELEIALGQKLLPAADKFLQWVTNLVNLFNKATTATPANDSSHKYIVGPGRTLTPNPNYIDPNGPAPTFTQGRYKIENGHRVNLPDLPTKTEEDKKKQDQEKLAEQQKKEQAARDAAANKADEQNKLALDNTNQMALAINMFSGAVQAFSSAVNIQQAWAAWAGEIGKANGLPGSSAGTSAGLTGGGRGNWRSSQYAADIKAAADSTGMDPQMLYAIMMTESHGINGQFSKTGAGGLMQVTKGNWKKMGGGADVMDPAKNIMVGAQIYAEQLRMHKGDRVAALGGYNGNSDPNYVSKVSSNYGGSDTGIGESRAKMNIRSVQSAIADYLHVPLDQIQLGGVKRGDASWAASQIQAGMQNNIYNIERQLSVGGLPAQNYAKLKMELRDQARGLDLMRQYSSGVVDSQQAGDRSRTIGERPIIINVNGTTDPKAVAEEVNKQLSKGINDVLQHYSTGVKG